MMSNSSTGIFLGRDASTAAAAVATGAVAEDDMAGSRSEQGEAWAAGLSREARQGARGIKETINAGSGGRSERQGCVFCSVAAGRLWRPSGNDGQIAGFLQIAVCLCKQPVFTCTKSHFIKAIENELLRIIQMYVKYRNLNGWDFIISMNPCKSQWMLSVGCFSGAGSGKSCLMLRIVSCLNSPLRICLKRKIPAR